MTNTPTDDQPVFVAEEPEHCHECYPLVTQCGGEREVWSSRAKQAVHCFVTW